MSAEDPSGSRRRLAPGTAFGQYRVEALVGSGGMGDVYRAIDTRLHRAVAIKLLAPERSSDPEYQARFEREARLLAALNHPHIAAIHGIESVDDIRALVLEFVEGQTLAEHLSAGRLSIDETLRIARQIAQALGAAHDKGIVHRDLKPTNIKITPAGDVKVLDFGIAKFIPQPDSVATTAAIADATRDGVIVGTAAYMSPEQTRGHAVDQRADIWAFGCVLYEMLTGRRAFDGTTWSDTIARILEREPDWSALPSQLPAAVHALLRRCLQKNAAERRRDLADVQLEISDVLSGATAAKSSSWAGRPGRRRLAAAAAVLTAVIALAAVWLAGPWRRPQSSQPAAGSVVEFGIRLPDNYYPNGGLAVSPDGRHVVVSAGGPHTQLWLVSLGTAEGPRPLPGTEYGTMPFWSPDSTTIGFISKCCEMLKIRIPDGQPTSICDLPWGPDGATWNERDEIVFAANGTLNIVRAAGGVPRRIPLPAGRNPVAPHFLADGRHVIVTDSQPRHSPVVLISVDGEEIRELGVTDLPAVFAPPGHLLFVRGSSLMSQAFNSTSLVLDGVPTRVASNVVPNKGLEWTTVVSASTTGVLAYVKPRAGSNGQLTWFDRTGRAEASVPPAPDSEFLNPALSPDGHFLAVNRTDPQTGNYSIWRIDLAKGFPSPLTAGSAQDADPVWSPDGKEIVFASDRSGRFGLYRKAVDGSSPEVPLLTEDGLNRLTPTDWSRDGRYILYQRGRYLPLAVFALPLFGKREPILVMDSGIPYAARFSPDGKWIAYTSVEGGSLEAWVRSFPQPGPKQRIGGGGGTHPRWSRDGREIVYWVIPNGGVNAVDFQADASGIHLGAARTLVQVPVLGLGDSRTHYDVTQDGQRLIVRQPSGPQQDGLGVILNWTARVK